MSVSLTLTSHNLARLRCTVASHRHKTFLSRMRDQPFGYLPSNTSSPSTMRKSVLRQASSTQVCEFSCLRQSRAQLLRQPRPSPRLPTTSVAAARRWYAQQAPARAKDTAPTPRFLQRQNTPSKLPEARTEQEDEALVPYTRDDLLAGVRQTVAARDKLLLSEQIPAEEEVVKTLKACVQYANMANDLEKAAAEDRSELLQPAAARVLATVEGKPGRRAAQTSPTIEVARRTLSESVHQIVTHSNVFLSEGVLLLAVIAQARLGRPDLIPEALQLYGSKPTPKLEDKGIVYHRINPNSASAAIPPKVAEFALNAAIKSRHASIAADVIDICYTTKAFKRAKFMQKALIPTIGVSSLPLVAYGLALKYAEWQISNSPEVATKMAFLGFCAYFGLTGMVGYTALTTANDQMNRVTWVDGTPLHERWFREEERAAIDKLVSSWGIQDDARRGEEEGEEWDALRAWVGIRGMWLDRVSLMQGL